MSDVKRLPTPDLVVAVHGRRGRVDASPLRDSGSVSLGDSGQAPGRGIDSPSGDEDNTDRNAVSLAHRGGHPMKVNVVGGGPGGLYTAILLKKRHPDWSVSLYERNPRGATYGWGVVFSDRTLDALRDADATTSTQITESFVLWDAIDVDIHGTLERCNGHTFAGIGRRNLLDILNRRCEELGVELHYDHPVTGLAELSDSDLIVAADGVHSAIRQELAERCQPRISMGDARYIWFGTNRTYDAFTFVFRESEFGLFQAHAYPFDAETSTFIVECHRETWERTGLSEDDEVASVQFCEELFAGHLAGRRLLSNRSHWSRFPTLRTRRWTAGNVVLLGDAAHTAHFSIGSGTKLALEDAIALADAFERHDSVGAALRDYELARKPQVAVLQHAAEESRDYFEHTARYYDRHPRQFTFHLLTRSGRLSVDNLRTRDPYFVADAERWFAAHAGGQATCPLVAPPPLFTPLQIGTTTFATRVVAVERPGLVASGGMPGNEHVEHYAELARRAVGAIITGPLAVEPAGRITPEDAELYHPQSGEAWRRITSLVHEHSDARIIARLSHAGRRGSARPRRHGLDLPLRHGGWDLLAPSSVPYHPHGQIPSAMNRDDMERVKAAFSEAAERAAQAGFDALLLDMAHGYLLSSFLSPLTNQRDDEYGGSCERRMCYPLEVLDALRASWGPDRPLLVALNGSDRARDGLTLRDAVRIARQLHTHGCDMLCVYAGQVTPSEQYDFDPNSLAQLSDVIRNEAGVPTVANGYMETSNQPNTLLMAGRADLCVVQQPD